MFSGLRCPFSRLLCWFRLRQFVFGAQSPRICSWFRLMYSRSRGRVAPVSLGRGLRLCLFAVAGVIGPWCLRFLYRAFLSFSRGQVTYRRSRFWPGCVGLCFLGLAAPRHLRFCVRLCFCIFPAARRGPPSGCYFGGCDCDRRGISGLLLF